MHSITSEYSYPLHRYTLKKGEGSSDGTTFQRTFEKTTLFGGNFEFPVVNPAVSGAKVEREGSGAEGVRV